MPFLTNDEQSRRMRAIDDASASAFAAGERYNAQQGVSQRTRAFIPGAARPLPPASPADREMRAVACDALVALGMERKRAAHLLERVSTQDSVGDYVKEGLRNGR